MTTSPTKALHDLGVSELAAGLRAKQFSAAEAARKRMERDSHA